MAQFNVTTGFLGKDEIPANSAVLLNERKVRVNGAYEMATEFMAVEGVKSTDVVDLIIPVLSVFVADARVRKGFKDKYGTAMTADGRELKTGLHANSVFTRFLKGDVIYKTNSNKEITRALVLDDGLTLSRTALKVTEASTLVAAKGDDLRTLIRSVAKGIREQATLRSFIISTAKGICKDAYVDLVAKAKASPKVDPKAKATAKATASVAVA